MTGPQSGFLDPQHLPQALLRLLQMPALGQRVRQADAGAERAGMVQTLRSHAGLQHAPLQAIRLVQAAALVDHIRQDGLRAHRAVVPSAERCLQTVYHVPLHRLGLVAQAPLVQSGGTLLAGLRGAQHVCRAVLSRQRRLLLRPKRLRCLGLHATHRADERWQTRAGGGSAAARQ